MALVAAPPLTASADGVATYSVWQWNISGNEMNKNSTTNGMTAAAADSIVGTHSDFAAFNEMCHAQFDDIIARLRTAGWPQDPANFARWAPAISGGTSTCNGGEFGNAIFSKQPLGAADRITLPDDGTSEHRNMLCDQLLSAPHMRFCTAHLSYLDNAPAPGSTETPRTLQLAATLTQMEKYHANGDTVIIAGDFNARPDWGRMKPYYSSAVNTPTTMTTPGITTSSTTTVGSATVTVRPPTTDPPSRTRAVRRRRSTSPSCARIASHREPPTRQRSSVQAPAAAEQR
ncbi:endonuclease/exonuclease/phosphatase family protein [Nocardia stercoris]|uniref:endonuclease/exonuclease/phosphatase family protein n=1 Tax=Nocardia stercoris TaxID=2483361 RepID=UPI0018F60C65|nr:endonuclease/exonuclease/phosphatase family protein [Nocardia stercoris]